MRCFSLSFRATARALTLFNQSLTHFPPATFHSQFKKRVPRAVKAVRQFARKAMGTKDVRLDVELNKFLWAKGIKSAPVRVRVRLTRKRNEDEEAREKMYTVVSYVPTANFKGLKTRVVDDA